MDIDRHKMEHSNAAEVESSLDLCRMSRASCGSGYED